MDSDQPAAGTVQCPYTLSTCPLFNPSASVLEAGRRSPMVPQPIPAPPLPSPPSQFQPQQSNAFVSMTKNEQGSRVPYDSLASYYSNYSLAPSPGRDDNSPGAIPSPPLPSSSQLPPKPGPPLRYQPYSYPPHHATREHVHATRLSPKQLSREASPEAGPSTDTSAAPSRDGSPHSLEGGFQGGPESDSPTLPASSSAEAVTPFISKLAHLLSHPQDFSSVIRWSADGSAFIFAHSSQVLLDVFAQYFRHSNVHSFVRQLNIYGFRRLSTFELLSTIPSNASATDYSGFSHPLMWREELGVSACDLSRLKPKTINRPRGKPKKESGVGPAPMRKSLGSAQDGAKAGGARNRLHV